MTPMAMRQRDDPDAHKGAIEGDRPHDEQFGNPHGDGVDENGAGFRGRGRRLRGHRTGSISRFPRAVVIVRRAPSVSIVTVPSRSVR